MGARPTRKLMHLRRSLQELLAAAIYAGDREDPWRAWGTMARWAGVVVKVLEGVNATKSKRLADFSFREKCNSA